MKLFRPELTVKLQASIQEALSKYQASWPHREFMLTELIKIPWSVASLVWLPQVTVGGLCQLCYDTDENRNFSVHMSGVWPNACTVDACIQLTCSTDQHPGDLRLVIRTYKILFEIKAFEGNSLLVGQVTF